MTKVGNRYLNLMSAPWSPSKPNGGYMLVNYFAAAAASLTIFGVAQVNPKVEKNQLMHLLEGLAGAAYVAQRCKDLRKMEANFLSNKFENLVIDTAPDKSSSKTSPDILLNTMILRDICKYSGILGRGPKGITIITTMAAIETATLMTTKTPLTLHVSSFLCGYFTVLATDVAYRYKHINKIAKEDWVIEDKSGAIKNFQKEEVEKLAGAEGIAMAPLNPR